MKKSPWLREEEAKASGTAASSGDKSFRGERRDAHVVGRALGTAVEVLAGVLGDPDWLLERVDKVHDVALEVLGRDVVPVENVCKARRSRSDRERAI